MKSKILVASLVLSFGLFACNQADASSGDVKQNDEKEKIAKVETSNKSNENSNKPINLSKADFLKLVMDYEKNPTEWIYKGDKPCLIDFWAEWCGPCKKAGPVLAELAKEYGDDIIIYKVNTETEKELAGVFGISSIPAFLYVPMEGKPQMTSGIARTTEDTKKMFKGYIDTILLNPTKVSEK